MTTNLHAHVSSTSADCDGRYDRDYITWLNDDEMAEHQKAQGVNDFHDLHFKERVLGGIVSFSPDHDAAEVRIHRNGFRYNEPTDEGYRYVEVTWCEDDCEDPDTYRDHTAEAMGY